MLVDMLKDPLQVVRLSYVIRHLTELSERVTAAGAISADDVENLAENVEHLKDFRPGGRNDD